MADETKDTAPAPAAARDPKRWHIFWVVGLISLVLDQITKIWARGSLPTNTPCEIPDGLVSGQCYALDVSVIDGFWYHRLSMNPGSAFGLFGSNQQAARIFLSIVGIAAVAGMVWMLAKSRTDQRVLHWALGFVVGGAIGNLIDRIYFGWVTDFILWRKGTFSWPVFNIADVVLVIGVGLMFIDIHKEGKREKALKREKTQAAGLVKH